MKEVQLYLNFAGYCLAKERTAIKGGANKMVEFKALFGLIKHDQLGWILYDTGYTERFYDATRKFPNSIYAMLTKVTISKEEEVIHQLKAFGIKAGDIRHIIVTHFHADHIGGLKDFPNATIYCSKEGFVYAESINKHLGFTKGILKSLMPEDLAHRVKYVEEVGVPLPHEIFKTVYDLFGDGSILAYSLPGHAKGQIGIQLQTKKQQYFLVADACWFKETFTHSRLPSPVVRLLFSSWSDYKVTVQKLHQFHTLFPDVKLVPTHCNKTLAELIPKTATLDEL